MKSPVFVGSAVAIVTPFTKDGVNFNTLGELIDFQINNNTDAIVICGTTGESATMPDYEHLSVIDYAVKHVAGRVPVIAGTGSNDTAHGVELSKEAAKLGADALLLVTPYYNKCSQKGLTLHFEAMANAVQIPCILYSVPSRTGVNINPETAFELSKIDNIVAIKEASGNISQVAKIASLCGDNLHIYSGNDDQIQAITALGGKGVISVVANILPSLTHDMVMKYINGDTKGALELQLRLLSLIDSLFTEVNPIPVKTALRLMGYDVGPLRLPLCDLNDKNLETLKREMAAVGLIQG